MAETRTETRRETRTTAPAEAVADAAELLGADGGTSPGEAASGAPDAGAEAVAAERTFTRAEVDRLIRQRLARAERDQEARLEAARAEGRSEAERRSRMTEEERLRLDREQIEQAARRREEALDAREAEIARRELRAEAVGRLAERELPRELGELLNYADAEALGASLDRLEAVFRAAVQSGIDARLRQGAPRYRSGGAAPAAAEMDDASYYASLKGR